MTISVPAELERAVQATADARQVTVDDVVREALQWYLSIDADLLDELTAWQQVRDEAWQAVEGIP